MRKIRASIKEEDMAEIVDKCIAKGKGMFPKPLPNIHDAADQLSDFLYGIQLGMRKVRANSKDIVMYLTTQGIYYLRCKRYKALRKDMAVWCECGKKLNTIESKPCHGTMKTRTLHVKEMCVDYDEWSIEEDSSGLQGHPVKAVHMHEEG